MHFIILYLFFAFYFFSVKEKSSFTLIFSIVSGVFLSATIAGILFKAMCWFDGELYVIADTISAILILATSLYYTLNNPENNKDFFTNMILRAGTLTIISILLFLTPATTLYNMEFRNDPELARLKGLNYNQPDNTD